METTQRREVGIDRQAAAKRSVGMNTWNSRLTSLGRMLLWIARIGSALSCGLLLLFVAGEGFTPRHLEPREMALFLCFPLGVALGMVCAWRWPARGGALTVVCLLGFYAAHWVQAGRLPRGWAFIVFAAPGFFFLSSATFCYLARKDQSPC
jgi:hypothetical protein